MEVVSVIYQSFQHQVEDYRYKLAQTMNELQIKYISNTTTSSADKKAVISQQNWIDFPDFQHQQLSLKKIIHHQWYSLFTLFLWMIGLMLLVFFNTKKLKAF